MHRKPSFSSAVLWRGRVPFALDPTKTETANKDLDCFERWVGPKLPTFEQFEFQGDFGGLGMVIEGAGKRRIFAIGNEIKQRLLYPYHKELMSVLARIPMDGTFDQVAPLGSKATFLGGRLLQ